MTSNRKSKILRLRSISGSEKGVALPVALVLLAVLAILGGGVVVATRTDLKISGNYKSGTATFYLAEAGADYARYALSQDWDLDTNSVNDQTQVFTNNQTVNWDSTGILSAVQAGSSGSITIVRDAADPSLAVITSSASFGSSSKTIKHVVKKISTSSPALKGALTTNGPTKTNGSIKIDGRDHSLSGCGSIVPNNGSYGVFSYSTYDQSGNSKVGGTDTSGPTDYAPSKPANPSVVVENSTDPMPTTPDEVMGGSANGYPEGTLKSITQSGVNGSQYVTDPANLTFPLSGATYVELPCGGEWKPANIEGSGVLIVHNSCTDAVIKNLNSGTFKGLLVADDIVHVHTDIIGAVYSLITTPSSGNVIGNGNGNICYSTEALNNLGLGPGDIQTVSWVEVM